MPVYEFTDPRTGVTIELEGATPPSVEVVKGAFAKVAPAAGAVANRQFNEASIPEKIVAGGENLLNFASSMAADFTTNFGEAAIAPAVSMAAQDIADVINKFSLKPPRSDEDRKALDTAISKMPAKIANMMRFTPVTDTGKQMKTSILSEISEAIKDTPIEKGLTFLDDMTRSVEKSVEDATGSRVLAEASTALPAFLLETMPMMLNSTPKKMRVGKGTPSEVRAAFTETPLQLEDITKVRNAMYGELKEGGYAMKPGTMNRMLADIKKSLLDEGVNLRAVGLDDTFREMQLINRGTKVKAAGNRAKRGLIQDSLEPLQRIEDTKQALYKRFANMDSKQKLVVNDIFDRMETWLDTNLDAKITPRPGVNVPMKQDQAMKLVRSARDLGSRAMRGKYLNDVLYSAVDVRGGGAEGVNLIKSKLKKIMDKEHVRKFYTPSERQLMNDIIQGKVNFDQGVLQLAGKTGATMAVPTARFLKGFFGREFRDFAPVERAKILARKMAGSDDKTIDAFKALQKQVLAGKTGEEAVIRYLKAVPKGKRSPMELAEILADPKFDLSKIETKGVKLRQDALEIAKGIRMRNTVLANAAVGSEDEE